MKKGLVKACMKNMRCIYTKFMIIVIRIKVHEARFDYARPISWVYNQTILAEDGGGGMDSYSSICKTLCAFI